MIGIAESDREIPRARNIERASAHVATVSRNENAPATNTICLKASIPHRREFPVQRKVENEDARPGNQTVQGIAWWDASHLRSLPLPPAQIDIKRQQQQRRG